MNLKLMPTMDQIAAFINDAMKSGIVVMIDDDRVISAKVFVDGNGYNTLALETDENGVYSEYQATMVVEVCKGHIKVDDFDGAEIAEGFDMYPGDSKITFHRQKLTEIDLVEVEMEID